MRSNGVECEDCRALVGYFLDTLDIYLCSVHLRNLWSLACATKAELLWRQSYQSNKLWCCIIVDLITLALIRVME